MHRIFEKLLFILICGFSGFVFLPMAFGTELYIPPVEGKAGQHIQVPIMINKVDNLAGIKLVMTYNPDLLTYKKAEKTKHTTSLMHIVNDKKPGVLIVVMAGPRGIKGERFSILSLTFETKKGLKSNHTEMIKITEIQMMSDKLKNIECDVKINPLVIVPDERVTPLPKDKK